MAVLQRIREFFVPTVSEREVFIPAPFTTYEIRLLTDKQLAEVWKLNQRCFSHGENYNRATFNYLLSQANTLSYRVITPTDEMVGFVFLTMTEEGVAHLTTIGVAPEHRRRGLAQKMLLHIENALRQREMRMICLEVRAGNLSAQTLYHGVSYAAMQRLKTYYNNGEDGILMVKSLV